MIGGSSAVGVNTARRAYTDGADVVLIGRNPERLQHATLELATGSAQVFVTVDDATWHWADASGSPVIINGLPRFGSMFLV